MRALRYPAQEIRLPLEHNLLYSMHCKDLTCTVTLFHILVVSCHEGRDDEQNALSG